MGTIRLVDDNCFKEVIDDGIPRLKLTINNGNFNREIRIAPHWKENWGGIDLLRFKLYHELNRTKVIAYGNMNQLPLLSILGDELMIQKSTTMESLYRGLSRIKNDIPIKNYVEAGLHHNQYPSEISNITNEQLLERFYDFNILIRQSTYELFKSLSFKSNLLIAEIKTGNRSLKIPDIIWLEQKLPLLGVDREFQRHLIQVVGDHYMGIQILASQLLNWVYISSGGSGNLFCLIPIKYMTYFDLMAVPKSEKYIRSCAIKQYGKVGEHWPIVQVCHQRFANKCFQSLDFEDMQYAIESIRNNSCPAIIRKFKPSIKFN